MNADSRERFLQLLRDSIAAGALHKLTLGRPDGGDPTLRNVFIRPVVLRGEACLTFVHRHDTRDLTKNHPPAAALALVETWLGRDFLSAHLFTAAQNAQLEFPTPGAPGRLRLTAAAAVPPATAAHDRAKQHLIPADAPWLQELGVTGPGGRVRADMTAKFRQINKFLELLDHLLAEAPLPAGEPLALADMGCGKGYLTFAAYHRLHAAGRDPRILGVEERPALVEAANRAATAAGFTHLNFAAGRISDVPSGRLDVLVALHACDTATDDALARGVAASAALLVVAPCCHKEIRPQLRAPPVLAPALRHGILAERQAEFVTDALRALLLEWAGYRTKVFEFVSTEHTAKNLMLAAVKLPALPADRDALAARVRAFAAFYGIRTQSLARQLNFEF